MHHTPERPNAGVPDASGVPAPLPATERRRVRPGRGVWLLFCCQAGCRWTMPSVDNAFPTVRVDVVKNDAPNYTVLVRNNSDGRLQVVMRSTSSKSWSDQKTHEERFVLEPKGQASFPVPLRTKRVRVVESRLISH